MPDASPRIDFRRGGLPHPMDILSAPSLVHGVRLGYELATRYREGLLAALDVSHQQHVELGRLRERYHAALDECRRLRAAQRRAG